MFFPVGDTPNPEGYLPWGNYLIIALNVAVYVLITLPLSHQGIDLSDPQVQALIHQLAGSAPAGMPLQEFLARMSAYDLFTFVHGFKPGAPSMATLFASLFLHGGFMHLFGNMLFLWIYGDNVEHRLGHVVYLATYLVTGAAATLFFAFFARGSMTPLVGASGAISGVLGLYFMLFPKNRVKVFVMLFPFFMDIILVPARLVLGIFILVDNFLPFLFGSASSVAYGAHIGGFIAGLAIAAVGERAFWNWPWQAGYHDVAKGAPPIQDPLSSSPIEELRAALRTGDATRALAATSQLERSDFAGLGPQECVTLAGWLEDAGHAPVANRILRGCLARHARAENLAEVYLALGLQRLKQGQPTAAYQYLLNVFDHHPDIETARRAQDALSRINVYRSAKRD